LGATRAPGWFPRLRGWRDALPMAKPSSPLSNKPRSALSKGSRTVCKPKNNGKAMEAPIGSRRCASRCAGSFKATVGESFAAFINFG